MKYRLNLKLLVWTLFLIFGLSSCGLKRYNKTRLDGIWSLQSMNNRNIFSDFQGNIPTLQFDILHSRIFGSGGCNRYFGNFVLSHKNSFSAFHIASTMMMCPNENSESQYLKLLSSSHLRILLQSDSCLIFKSHNKKVMEFVKHQITLDKALCCKWQLIRFEGRSTKKVFKFKNPVIEFDNNGQVFGCAGCNRFRSTYTFTFPNSLSIAIPITTRMACEDMAHENEFLNIITSPLKVKISRGYLSFTKDGKVLMVFQKDKN